MWQQTPPWKGDERKDFSYLSAATWNRGCPSSSPEAPSCVPDTGAVLTALFKSFALASFGLLTRLQNCFSFKITLYTVTSCLETWVWSGVCPAVEFLQPGRSQHKSHLARGFIHMIFTLTGSPPAALNLTRHFLQYILVAGTWNNTPLGCVSASQEPGCCKPLKAAPSWGNKSCNTLFTALLAPSKRDRVVRTATSHWNTVPHLI